MGLIILLVAGGALAGESPTVLSARQALQPMPGVVWAAAEQPWAGGTWVLMEPSIEGIPVLDRDAAVDVAPDGMARRVRAMTLVARGGAIPTLDASQAIAAAAPVVRLLGDGTLWRPYAELAWQPVGDTLSLAWAVRYSTAEPPAVWRVAVDAHSGRVLRTQRESATATAEVYARSPLDGARETVELANLDEGLGLAGAFVMASSCVLAGSSDGLLGAADCTASTDLATVDEDGSYIFADRPASFDDPQAEVQLYHHVDRIAAWLDDLHGFRHETPIRAYANFEMANAFYGDFDGDGQGDISFGQSADGVDFAYDADVAYHEFGHSVVDALADVPSLYADSAGLEWAGGSLNEGAADIFSMVLTRSPEVGPYAATAFDRTAIRHLETDRRCPDDLRGEVHRDGEILGAFAWNVMTDPRIPEGTMGDLLMGALPEWGQDISWARAGRSLRRTSAALRDVGVIDLSAHEAVVEHLLAANLPDCGRAIPMQLGASYDMFMTKSGLGGELSRVPLGTQFAISVPEDATSIWVQVDTDLDVGWSLFGRADTLVEHEPVVVPGIGVGTAVPIVWDWTRDGFGPGVVRLEPGGDQPLVPGAVIYLSVSSWSGDVVDLDALYDLERITISTRVSTAVEGVEVSPAGCSTSGLASGWLGLWAWLLVRRKA